MRPTTVVSPSNRARHRRIALLVLVAAGVLVARPWRLVESPPPTRRDLSTEASIAAFEAQIAADPNDTESLGLLGKLYLIDAQETGDLERYLLAEERLRAALAADPSSTRLRGMLAEALLGQQRYREALEVAGEAWERDRGELRALTVIGDALAALGRTDEAERTFEGVRAVAPVPAILVRLGSLAERRGDFARARALMEEALAAATAEGAEPEKRVWYVARLCRFHFDRGALVEARRLCDEALALRDDESTLAVLGRIAAAEGRTKEAIALVERAVARKPEPGGHELLAELYESSAEPEQAALHMALAVEIAEQAPIARAYRRFLAELHARREGGAKRALELAREELAEREDARAWDLLAFALYANGRLDEAAEASARALAPAIADPQIHFHAGLIEHARGNHETARAHLERALALNPHFSLTDAAAARKLLEEMSS